MDKLRDRWQLFLISANAPWRARWIWISVIAAPISWIATLRILGGPFRSAQDPLALATTLSAIIGGIFVAGGLVIALAAVVTLLSVDERVKRQFEKELARFQEDADTKIGAYFKMVDARTAPYWPDAERLTADALRDYPGLPNARLALGIRLADHIVAYFMDRHRPSRISWSKWAPSYVGVVVAQRSRQGFDPGTEGGLPVGQATAWLESAVREGEDTTGIAGAMLAVLAGSQGQFQGVLSHLDRKIDGATVGMMHSTNLQDADLLAMLCLPCIGDAEKMRQVGTRLGISLPVSIGTVASVAEELELSGTREGVLGYYAAARTGAWPAGGADLFPHQVLLQVRATGAGTREGRVLLPGLDRAEIAHAIQYDEHQFRPLSQVLHDFDATCLIICAIPSDPGPPGM